MKSKLTLIYTCCLLFVSFTQSFGQPGDDINGRLWRLAKVWGFVKYYHYDNCSVDWNAILVESIDSVLHSTSNAEFNDIMLYVLNAAGPVPDAPEPFDPDPSFNLNAPVEWMDDSIFSQPVRDLLDHIIANYSPAFNCLYKKNDHADPNYDSYIDFRNDPLDPVGFSYDIESHRLQAYIYYWNAVNYFQADKDLMDQPWDTTLIEFMPIIRGSATDEDFYFNFIRLTTRLNDSHGFTLGSLGEDNLFSSVKIKLRYIEGATIVEKVDNTIGGITRGDILVKVDGQDVDLRRDSVAQFIAASNDSYLNLRIDLRLLRGPHNSSVDLELLDSLGNPYNITLQRTIIYTDYADYFSEDSNPLWEITDCGYGYVNMGKLMPTQVPGVYNKVKDAPAIIFDLRNYPNRTVWGLLPFLLPESTTWALLTEPDLTIPGYYSWLDNKYAAGNFINPNYYQGKVIILANASSVSQSEYTVMGLQVHPHAFTIGSQTGGADGEYSYINLPGGIETYWTSLGIYYPDTITAQRAGVRIDSIVIPTIEDIRHGRDAELLAALDCLVSTEKVEPIIVGFDCYPNPVDDELVVSFKNNLNKPERLEMFNQLGQEVYGQFVSAEEMKIDVSKLMRGIYSVVVINENGSRVVKRIVVE